MRQFIYNGRSSADYGLAVSGEDTFRKPAPDSEHIGIPGRNGDLVISNNRFRNIDVIYHVGIRRDFLPRYRAFMNAVLSSPGYHRLEDSYHPGHFRLAVMESSVEPKTGQGNRNAVFDLTFSCKPQMYLKEGEQVRVYTEDATIYNPTVFEARPLLRVYGTGMIGIGSGTITVTSADGYTDIDCEMMDAYKGGVNCNGNIQLSGGEFPVLSPGWNGISIGSGITRLELTPRWWEI